MQTNFINPKTQLFNPDMTDLLKNHPFAVEAFFERSVVLTFSVPKARLEHLLPECLQLDTFKDHWAFVAMAMVQTKSLRPKGFPKIFGNDFFLTGYRVFVRKYTNTNGLRLRGLYILKSETNKKKIEFFWNIFTHYKYTTTDIKEKEHDKEIVIESNASRFKIELDLADGVVPLPENSPFADWKEARRFAGPLPFTFTYNKETKEVLIIEGVREHWQPNPIKVISYQLSFLEEMGLADAVLANAFVINQVPYYWKKGKIEQWKS